MRKENVIPERNFGIAPKKVPGTRYEFKLIKKSRLEELAIKIYLADIDDIANISTANVKTSQSN